MYLYSYSAQYLCACGAKSIPHSGTMYTHNNTNYSYSEHKTPATLGRAHSSSLVALGYLSYGLHLQCAIKPIVSLSVYDMVYYGRRASYCPKPQPHFYYHRTTKSARALRACEHTRTAYPYMLAPLPHLWRTHNSTRVTWALWASPSAAARGHAL